MNTTRTNYNKKKLSCIYDIYKILDSITQIVLPSWKIVYVKRPIFNAYNAKQIFLLIFHKVFSTLSLLLV